MFSILYVISIFGLWVFLVKGIVWRFLLFLRFFVEIFSLICFCSLGNYHFNVFFLLWEFAREINESILFKQKHWTCFETFFFLNFLLALLNSPLLRMLFLEKLIFRKPEPQKEDIESRLILTNLSSWIESSFFLFYVFIIALFSCISYHEGSCSYSHPLCSHEVEFQVVSSLLCSTL